MAKPNAPSALEKLLTRFRPGTSGSCECGRPHEIRTRLVTVAPGALNDIPVMLEDAGLSGKVVVTFESNIREIVETKVFPILKEALIKFEPLCIDKPGEVQANLVTAGELMERLPQDAKTLMCIGSGTMNDLSKYSAAVRGLPYVSVATAASMNGYTSSISALSAGNFKTTQETTPPVAVLADVDILKDAPVEMTRAGLGDLLSKWVCNADWKLSQLVRKTYFCDVPFELIREQEGYYMSHAAELSQGSPEAVQALTEAIMISGFSMSIVGVSSPSSGSEHLISHTWEMREQIGVEDESAPIAPTAPRRLHGAQVGVTTVLMARLYELVAELDPMSINAQQAAVRYPTWDRIRGSIQDYFGPIAPEILKQMRDKYPQPGQLELELEWILGNWSRLWQQLKRFRKSSAELVEVLSAAGAPYRPADLGIDRDEALQGILHARYMRARYTILDLAEALGVLEELAEKVCDEYC